MEFVEYTVLNDGERLRRLWFVKLTRCLLTLPFNVGTNFVRLHMLLSRVPLCLACARMFLHHVICMSLAGFDVWARPNQARVAFDGRACELSAKVAATAALHRVSLRAFASSRCHGPARLLLFWARSVAAMSWNSCSVVIVLLVCRSFDAL